jgi:LysR family glycine cleavage system transcriptional activator
MTKEGGQDYPPPMRRLPPMNSLRAFEAVVRLGSFTAAARELGVTHGAISRQIKIIEGFLGTRLFRPLGRGLAPTDRARDYATELRASFDRIDLATERMAEPTTLRVNAAHTIALRWLLPRLPSFLRRHPEIDVRLSASSLSLEKLEEPFDIVIRRRPMKFPGFRCRPFLQDVSLPVVAPAVIAAKPVSAPDDLLRHTLLSPDSPEGAWDRWLALAGVKGGGKAKRQRFDHFHVALQAAVEGLGFCLAPLSVVADDLEHGRLIAPLPAPALVCEPAQVLYPAEATGKHRANTFVSWLLEQEGTNAAPIKPRRRARR